MTGWDLATGTLLARTELGIPGMGKGRLYINLAMAPNGDEICVAIRPHFLKSEEERQLLVLEVDSHKIFHRKVGKGAAPGTITFQPNSRFLVVSRNYREVAFLDLDNDLKTTKSLRVRAPIGSPGRIIFSRNGSQLFITCNGQLYRFLIEKTGSSTRIVQPLPVLTNKPVLETRDCKFSFALGGPALNRIQRINL